MNYRVSIVCITYNQESFIQDALESFISQKTNFDFQVIISDDCSTDNTPNIIKEYEKKYPKIIKAFYHKQNMGVIKNYLFALSKVDTKYLIVNEGDDYFIDSNKLQKQVDFLESNPDYSICFHPVKIIYEDKSGKTSIYPDKKIIKSELSFDMLLKSNFMQTNSVLYRWNKNCLYDFPNNILPCDWYLHLLHAKKGKIGVIDEVMSVYRRNSSGIWTDADKTKKNLHRKYGILELNFFNSVYTKIANTSDDYLFSIYIPSFKCILDNYYSFGDIEKILEIKKSFPKVFEKAFNVENPLNLKLKKYKSLFKKLLIFLIILLIIVIVQFILLLFKW